MSDVARVSVRKEMVLMMICACDSRGLSGAALMIGDCGWLLVDASVHWIDEAEEWLMDCAEWTAEGQAESKIGGHSE